MDNACCAAARANDRLSANLQIGKRPRGKFTLRVDLMGAPRGATNRRHMRRAGEGSSKSPRTILENSSRSEASHQSSAGELNMCHARGRATAAIGTAVALSEIEGGGTRPSRTNHRSNDYDPQDCDLRQGRHRQIDDDAEHRGGARAFPRQERVHPWLRPQGGLDPSDPRRSAAGDGDGHAAHRGRREGDARQGGQVRLQGHPLRRIRRPRARASAAPAAASSPPST